MGRAAGRHEPAAGDVYTEHPGVVVPRQSRWEADWRAHRAVSAVVLLLTPVVLVLVLAVPAAPYWDQPDQQATITAAVPDGTLARGKSTCDAGRFTVQGPDGRIGDFTDCSDERRVGDRVTVRWRSATSSAVAVDVLSEAEVVLIGVLAAVACAAVGVVGARSERRRHEQLASPTFRTRGG